LILTTQSPTFPAPLGNLFLACHGFDRVLSISHYSVMRNIAQTLGAVKRFHPAE
jgi:hypothetical protein